jgi:formate dehydrogenase major subunit
MVKEGESFKDISFDEAVLLAAENLTSTAKKYGRDSIAFAVSPDISNETAQMVKEMASKLGTDLTGSFTRISKGLSSTAKLEDIKYAEAVFIVGDIYKKYPVLGAYFKNAAKMGASIIEMKNADAAWEVIQGHIDRDLKAAKKTIIIIDEDMLNDGLIRLGMKTFNSIGIILVRSKSNSQGILNLGFDISCSEILEKINNGTIKALVVLGEDPAGYIKGAADAMKRLEFMLTADLYTTKTTENSCLVLPLSSLAEDGGCYTRCDGVIQYGIPAVKPISGWSSNKVLAEITKRISPGISSTGVIHKKYGNDQALSSIDYSAGKSVFSTIDLKFQRCLLEKGIKV